MAAHLAIVRLRHRPLAVHHHQRLLHQRDERALAAALRMDLAAGDRERAAGLDDEAFRDDALALRGGQQVELEFDRQHRAVLGEQREAGVAAGGIDDRRHECPHARSRAAATVPGAARARSRNSPARRRSISAPISAIAPCRAKLSRTRSA